MSKQALLDQIKADIRAKNICPDLAKQATQLVFGSGNPDAQVVFIGEAPGKNEDLKGEPFVGASGKFLDEMLASVGLSRKDIYITNIVKYRPPNNRDPLPEEKEAFLPFLYAQLAAINPKIIVTLGRHSTNCFLPGLQISVVHGQPKRIRVNVPKRFTARQDDKGASGVQGKSEQRTETYKEYVEGAEKDLTKQSAAKHDQADGSAGQQVVMTFVILPLYHPAAALYNGSMRQVLLDDFATVPLLLTMIGTPQSPESSPESRTPFSSPDVATATSHSEKRSSESPEDDPGEQAIPTTASD